MTDKGWSSGDTVILRSIANSDGSVVTSVPAIVVRDTPEVLATFIPAGTVAKTNWVVPVEQRVSAIESMPPSAQREHQDIVVRLTQLRLYLPGAWFSVHMGFAPAGDLTSWYGNLEAPFARTPIGIDTRDFALDVVAYPDGTWRWKDEDEFARRRELGLDSESHQMRVRAAGEDFVRRFEAGSFPFDQGWELWRPPAEWKSRTLPQGWDADFGTDKVLVRAG